ncbi:MAG: hypothetical protein J5934_01375 [Succinivibrio sp.]|nr:hypothetical protein [Succinivibrio sp.]
MLHFRAYYKKRLLTEIKLSLSVILFVCLARTAAGALASLSFCKHFSVFMAAAAASEENRENSLYTQ